MSFGPPTYETLIGLWQEGERRLSRLEPSDRDAAQRVIEELVLGLRRRLGGPFSVKELARLYNDLGLDWCFDAAVRVAPANPEAWDLPMIGGAAFARYAREAMDYTTGRRVPEQQ
jgi:hypothetical protein